MNIFPKSGKFHLSRVEWSRARLKDIEFYTGVKDFGRMEEPISSLTNVYILLKVVSKLMPFPT